jgi:sulfide:quinone oxidoreductase
MFLSLQLALLTLAPSSLWGFQMPRPPTGFTGVQQPSTDAARSTFTRLEAAHLSDESPARRIVVVGGGIGGLSSAFDARHQLRRKDQVVVISDRPEFTFTPSNPWVAIRKRKPEDIQVNLTRTLPRHRIEFIHGSATSLFPDKQQLQLHDGTMVDYDFLIIATGPRFAFETIPGLKEYGYSVCTTPHALEAAEALDELTENPGPVVIGAVQGASCFGPAYEYAFLLQHELEKRGGPELVKQCPITFVTPEPELGHMGLNGAGDSKKMMINMLAEHHMQSFVNTRIEKVEKGTVFIEQLDEVGNLRSKAMLPSKLTMLIPPFHGKHVWKNVPGLTDDQGLILINEYQQSPKYANVFGVGISVSIPNQEPTIIPIGIPKTGYLIESQGTAAVQNIKSVIEWQDLGEPSDGPNLTVKPLLNALCITDFGYDGAIFVTMPQIPPRKFDWTIQGKVATLAKIGFEKYFLHKVESGDTDP